MTDNPVVRASLRCPACGRNNVRFQASGPSGTVAGEHGPVIAYPCQHWLVPSRVRAARRLAVANA